jgi:hypothetical protein
MKIKIILILLIIEIGLNLYGQTLDEATKVIKKIKKIEKIDKLKKKYPDWYISVDKTMISDSSRFPEIIKADIGDIILKQYNPNAPRFVLKVLSIEEEELCKAKYIYISGVAYNKFEIDSIRTLILDRFKNGEDFETLAKEYTMDNNPTGDLNWFYKGMMVDEFDKAVRYRKKDEIFTVDVDSKNWYYVVLKTHDNKREKAIKSVMIKYGI